MKDAVGKWQASGMEIGVACIAVLFLRSVLDFLYINYVHKFWGFPFAFHGINTLRLLESYAITLMLAIWLSSSLYRRWRPSGVALVLYFIVVMLPLTTLYGLAGAPPAFIYAAAGSFAVLLVVTELLPKVKVPRPSHNLLAMGALLLVGMSVYVYAMQLLSGGLSRLSFDLLSVYEVRAEFVQTRAPLMGYFIPWQGYVLNITLFCWGMARRKWWLVAAAVAASLFLFGMVGVKAYLFAPALAGGVYFLWHRRHGLFYVIGALAVLVIASYLSFLVSGNHLAPSLLVRRLFFVPAANHLIYYDFFSQPDHPFVMLSDSILEGFVPYPYDMPMVRMIAWEYWGKDFGPNVGYLADAFAHFGFMGMFLFSMLLGLFLRMVDSVGARLPGNLVAAVVVVPAMALTNSALFTSLLTHGLILAVAVIWLLRGVEERRTKARIVHHSKTWQCQQTPDGREATSGGT